MYGNDVLMVSGTDEHGTPLLVQADKEGVNVRELTDRYNRQIVEDLVGLGQAVGHQPDDTGGHGGGLARAGAGDDEQRAGARPGHRGLLGRGRGLAEQGRQGLWADPVLRVGLRHR